MLNVLKPIFIFKLLVICECSFNILVFATVKSQLIQYSYKTSQQCVTAMRNCQGLAENKSIFLNVISNECFNTHFHFQIYHSV